MPDGTVDPQADMVAEIDARLQTVKASALAQLPDAEGDRAIQLASALEQLELIEDDFAAAVAAMWKKRSDA